MAYVRAYRERLRDQSKELARIADSQAVVIGSMFSQNQNVPTLWEAFHCWTDEEAEQMETDFTIQQLKRDLFSMRPQKGGMVE